MSTKHITTDRRFAEILAEDHPQIPLPTIEATMLGWAAKHPAPVHEEIAPCPREDREKSAAARIPRCTGWGAPPPPEQVAANLERMAS